jgi:hypothetical protein
MSSFFPAFASIRGMVTDEMRKQAPAGHDQFAGKLSSMIVTANLGADNERYDRQGRHGLLTRLAMTNPTTDKGFMYALYLRARLISTFGCTCMSVKPELRRIWKWKNERRYVMIS